MKRAFSLLVYDISDDKRRAKIARIMEALGERVQGSVFEAWLTPGELEKVLEKSKKIMEPSEDSLRVYALCEACRRQLKMLGQGKTTPPPDVLII